MNRLLPIRGALLALLRRDLRVLPLVVVFGLAAAALEGLGIGLIIPLLDLLLGRGEGGASAGLLPEAVTRFAAGMPPRERLMVLSITILGLILLKNVTAFANAALSAWVYGRASHAMRMGLTYRLTWVGQPFFQKESPGRLLNIISNESWRASDAIATALGLVVHACAVVILFLFLWLISWQLTLAVLLGIAATQVAHTAMTAGLKALSGRVTEHNGRLASRMLHLVEGARLIRAFGQEDAERSRFAEASDAVRRLLLRLEIRRAVLAPASEVMHAFLFLAIIAGAWIAGVSFSVVAAFLILLYRMQPHVRALQNSSAQLQSLHGSLAEVEWLLGPDGKAAPPTGSIAPGRLRNAVRFDRVSVTFPGPGAAPVLRDISFSLRAGRSTGLVGRSGAGKTTIVNLICRFLEPDTGAIWIDDAPLSEIDPAAWRSRLAVASQDLDLIEGTIAENIRYGLPAASMDRVLEAAIRADADTFIQALPQGYYTRVGHRGLSLSAGQRQRIALARALVRDPEILILDEATNAVDGISETAILQTLQSRTNRTTIVISHHRKTLACCDDIVILRGGQASDSLPLATLDGADMEQIYDFMGPGTMDAAAAAGDVRA